MAPNLPRNLLREVCWVLAEYNGMDDDLTYGATVEGCGPEGMRRQNLMARKLNAHPMLDLESTHSLTHSLTLSYILLQVVVVVSVRRRRDRGAAKRMCNGFFSFFGIIHYSPSSWSH